MTLELTPEDYDELAGHWPSKYQTSRGELPALTRAASKSRRFLPKFAASDAQLQAVLLHAATRYAFRYKPIPPDFVPDLATIVELAKARHAEERAKVENSQALLQQRIYQNILSVEEVGGYVAFIGAVAYRAWRLMWPNSLIAAELNVSHDSVEDVGQMLRDYAEELGFETYKHPAHRGRFKVDQDNIAALWTQGNHSARSIAKILCHDHGTVRRALKRLGLLTGPHRADEAAILELWDKGYRLTQIKDELGNSVATITRILKRRGVYVADRFWKDALGRDRLVTLAGKGRHASTI